MAFRGFPTNGKISIGSTGAQPVEAVPTNGTNISWTTGAGSLTANLTGQVAVANGGTGQSTLTNHGVLVGAATSAITQLAAGSAGQVLQSGGASADPAYSTATYPSTATGTGKVLVADGTNWVASTPTFPNASATSGKIIQSDGTNWIASTPTFPAAAGTSGNVLTSDGTNWTSAAATSSALVATVTLTSAQIKALHATPIQIVAAPGAGKMIVLMDVGAVFNYGGTNVFVAGAGQTITLNWNGTSKLTATTSALASNANITGTANVYNILPMGQQIGKAAGELDNVSLILYNPVATEISGNAANNNTMTIYVSYFIFG